MAPNNQRKTKAQRREEARAQAKALREEQLRKEKRAQITRRALLGGGVVAVAGIGTAVYLNKKDARGIYTAGDSDATITLPDLLAQSDDMPQHVREDGAITLGSDLTAGSVNEGAPVVSLFFDYYCPHCQEFEVVHKDEINELVSSGEVTLALYAVKILGSSWTDDVNNALASVLNHEPEKVLDFHAAAFDLYGQAAAQGSAALLTIENLVAVAQEAGISETTTAEFAQNAEANTYEKFTELTTQTFTDGGLTGTPSVMVNGEVQDLTDIASATGLTDVVS